MKPRLIWPPDPCRPHNTKLLPQDSSGCHSPHDPTPHMGDFHAKEEAVDLNPDLYLVGEKCRWAWNS